MSSTIEKPNAAAAQLSPEDLRQFLYREARFLDDKEWDNWLALYAPNVEFWMPGTMTINSSPTRRPKFR